MRVFLIGIVSFILITLLIPIFIVIRKDVSTPQYGKPSTGQIVVSDLVVSVYNHETKEIMNIGLEEYVVGVVAGEAPALFGIEALKAQAVAARTYALYRRALYGDNGNPDHPGAILCTSHQHCQEWLSEEMLKKRHGDKWIREYLPKIEESVSSTRGIILTYDMKPIEPLYHSTSGGHTENSEDVFVTAIPYLRGVSSPYEAGSPVLVDEKNISVKEFVKKISEKHKDIKINEKKISSEINILERSSGGNIKSIKIGNKELTGRDVRGILELRSANFTVDVKGKEIIFTTKGYGHGVGMSQWGANGMAKEGSTFEEILTHYYQGVNLSVLKSHKE